MPKRPDRTRAIVVGIEDYGEAAPRVRGPASDAVRFAEWLAARGVPWGSIALALAPHPELRTGIRAKLPYGYRPATTVEVGAILKELSVATGEALIFYWAGHGADDGGEPRLLLADTGTSGVALEVAGLRRWLRSLAGLPEQVFFVDTCRRYDRTVFAGIRPLALPATEPASSVQSSALYAVGYGQGAAVVPGGLTSLFSSALQAELGALSAETWPPDVEELGRRLEARGGIPAPVVVDERTRRGGQQRYLIGPTSDVADPVPHKDGPPDDRPHHNGRGTNGQPGGSPRAGRPRDAKARRTISNLLVRVPSMGRRRNIDELVTLLKERFDYGFIVADSPSVEEVVHALDGMAEGWCALRAVCDERPRDLFPAGQTAVIELIAALDGLIAQVGGCRP